MRPIIIDGRTLAKDREEMLRKRVAGFTSIHGRRPKLLAIELSDDEGSRLYLKLKRAAAQRTEIEFQVTSDKPSPRAWVFDSEVTQTRGAEGLQVTSQEPDGIFVQHPPGYDGAKWRELVDRLHPDRDVDCLTSKNLDLVRKGKPTFLPAAVKSVGYCVAVAAKLPRTLEFPKDQSLLRKFLKRKSVVIIGRSDLVGNPLFWWLGGMAADASQLHSKTPRDEFLRSISSADILVSATGTPRLISADMVKHGAVVIDVGSPKGDVVFDEVAKKTAAITPVPGGVGPLTVVSLMENVLQAAENHD